MSREGGASSIQNVQIRGAAASRLARSDYWVARSSPAMTAPDTLGLILAGGLARRMGGGDKLRIRIAGVTILGRVLARLSPQCRRLVINANGDPARFGDTALPVVADSVPDFAGPLAGILAGLDFAAADAPGCEWIVSVPGDCPFLPANLVERLHETREASAAALACAQSGQWRHPVVGLWPVALREDLRQALAGEGLHKIELWTGRHGVAIAGWPDTPVDPFFNVNTPDDAARAEAIAEQHPGA
jgi:molybdenum cofactor guanylyltransferase